ncbi:HMG-Y-related protein B [Solanum lycopersicum]|uniref:HMG-Y-related protein B-like n=1 Tax=Solanum pennellii TaxID=28526 RepID=A0ABM1GWB2_SOLPN|nr:HMG-Y-related protein B [Solanum lycopersicum]XP_015076901.1 HMG-Y-related protein B-like [Solanum pennellii]
MATQSFNQFPSYPEMIYEALDELNQEGGANKSSISKYIETKYGDLNEDLSKMLPLHLDNMKQNGDLIFLKNNYIKPGPDVPAKRGRGRPPKPKAPLPPGAVESVEPASPRPRGRPRKDPNAPPSSKKPKPESVAGGPNSTNLGSTTGRPRGRPRKVRPQPAHDDDDDDIEEC